MGGTVRLLVLRCSTDEVFLTCLVEVEVHNRHKQFRFGSEWEIDCSDLTPRSVEK